LSAALERNAPEQLQQFHRVLAEQQPDDHHDDDAAEAEAAADAHAAAAPSLDHVVATPRFLPEHCSSDDAPRDRTTGTLLRRLGAPQARGDRRAGMHGAGMLGLGWSACRPGM